MKTVFRAVSSLLALMMIIATFAACGTTAPTATNAPATQATTSGTEASVPFIAPPDQIGLVISADIQLITWQPYETKEDTIFLQIVYGRTQSAFSEGGLMIGAGLAHPPAAAPPGPGPRHGRFHQPG